MGVLRNAIQSECALLTSFIWTLDKDKVKKHKPNAKIHVVRKMSTLVDTYTCMNIHVHDCTCTVHEVYSTLRTCTCS